MLREFCRYVVIWGKHLIGDTDSQILLKVSYSHHQFGVWTLCSRTWPSGCLHWFRILQVTWKPLVWTQLISSLTRIDHYALFSCIKLEFVSSCLQSIGPKPSLWALNRWITFPGQHFKCWEYSSPRPSLWAFGPLSISPSPQDPALPPWTPSPLVLLWLIYMPSEVEGLEFNMLLLMIKISFIKQMYFDKCYTN